jgi:uncharacterized protein DUF3667
LDIAATVLPMSRSQTLEPSIASVSDSSAGSEPNAASDASPTTAASRCANCGASIPAGHYCSTCGAPRLDERPFTVRRFAHDIWSEVTSLDSHSVRTFRALLTSPGKLTKDFLDGRTRWYLPPLRVYLLTFGFMIFARSFTTSDRTGVKSVVFVAGGQLAMFVVPLGVAMMTSIWTAVSFAAALKRSH